MPVQDPAPFSESDLHLPNSETPLVGWLSSGLASWDTDVKDVWQSLLVQKQQIPVPAHCWGLLSCSSSAIRAQFYPVWPQVCEETTKAALGQGFI